GFCHGRICLFFFQAEDGIRDFHVTGVQTCALPIFRAKRTVCVTLLPLPGSDRPLCPEVSEPSRGGARPRSSVPWNGPGRGWPTRSEERRVGKECRPRWAP